MTKEPKVAAAPREPGALRGTRWGEGLWSIVRELNRLGIDVRHENSGVGSNLQEHPGFMLRWHSRLRTVNDRHAPPRR